MIFKCSYLAFDDPSSTENIAENSIMVRPDDAVMPEIKFIEAVPDFYYSASIPNRRGYNSPRVKSPIMNFA